MWNEYFIINMRLAAKRKFIILLQLFNLRFLT